MLSNCFSSFSTISQTLLNKVERVLVTGCKGQIGSELIENLREKFGKDNVVATDIATPTKEDIEEGPYYFLDVMNKDRLDSLVKSHDITWIIHNAAFLSAMAEKYVSPALALNTVALHNVFEVAEKYNTRLMVPSSIAAFGPSTPLDNTPNLCVQKPMSVYGIGKVYAELLGEYMAEKRGVDFRSLRYPGIISWKTLPGGGTTDYAVDMFYYALLNKPFECYLKPDESLPMMYMPDCIKSTVDLMEAPAEKLSTRSYNVTSFSFTPEELTNSIKKYIPNFQVTYNIDTKIRQPLAASWPNSLDDSLATKDWGWKPSFSVDQLCEDMLINLSKKLNVDFKL